MRAQKAQLSTVEGMKNQLSQYIDGAALKLLSAVEARPEHSNQHEFNGVSALKSLLGTDKKTFPARFLYLAEHEDDLRAASGFLTWYDAREAQRHRAPEFRLYFPSTAVSEQFQPRDLLVVAKRPNNELLVIVARHDSTAERQVRWLFSEFSESERFVVRDIHERDHDVDYAARVILEQLGVEIEMSDDTLLGTIIERFGSQFPSTRQFSELARAIKSLQARDDPDKVLIEWIDMEERLFRTLERHLVRERLRHGFEEDVDGFIEFSLSVQNRRKSRAGQALENHLEEIFIVNRVRFARGQYTEARNRPDFIFPSIVEYRNESFPAGRLTMLGAKSTCKDRWRQVLSEAARIPNKHLVTLEPGISEHQTSEMRSTNLQLVLPKPLHQTYRPSQLADIWDLKTFIEFVRNLESRSTG